MEVGGTETLLRMRTPEGASLTHARERGEAPRSAEHRARNATLECRTCRAGYKVTKIQKDMQVRRFLIRRTRQGGPILLQARKETAEFYGWDKHFQPYLEGYRKDPETGVEYINQPRLKKWNTRSGVPLRISRTASKSGQTRTQVNHIRVSSDATTADIAQVAKFTDVDWNWMETPSGERRSRDKWLAIQEAWTQ